MESLSKKACLASAMTLLALLGLTACSSEIEEIPTSNTRSESYGTGTSENKGHLLHSKLSIRIAATDTIVRNTLQLCIERSLTSQEDVEMIADQEFSRYLNNHESEKDNLQNSELHHPVLETLSPELYDVIMAAYVDEDYDRFRAVCSAAVKEAVETGILDAANVYVLEEELQSLISYREMILNIMVDFYQPETRTSPGDIKIWQNCVHAMTKDQIKIFINVSIAGLFYTPSAMGVLGYLCGIGTSLW